MKEELLQKDYWHNLLDQMQNWGLEKGPSIVLTCFIFFISLQLARIILRKTQKVILKRLEKKDPSHESEKRAKTLLDILRGIVKVSIWMVFLIMILKDLGIDVAPLIAGAGIAGLAIGFGAQELVKDVISGFFMLLEDQIRIGDVVSINQTEGVVEKIELRTVTLRDMKGVVHVFQNGKIDTLANMTKEWSAAVFDIGVSYSSNLSQVLQTMQAVGEDIRNSENFKDSIIENLEIFGLNSFGDNALVVKARLKTKPGDQWRVKREFNARLKSAFDKEGIEIPFPQRTIHYAEKK